MEYDSSAEALFSPQHTMPLVMDRTWKIDAIAAEVARLAYFRIETDDTAIEQVQTAMARIGYGGVQRFPLQPPIKIPGIPDPQGFCAVTPQNHAIIAFRGTQPDSIPDAFSDVLFPLVRWPGAGRVHLGFWQALKLVLGEVRAWITRVKPDRLVITGHSLGAAMATLLAGLYPHAELITFGSPRVGTRAFADSFAGRAVRRYVDNTDIVTHAPVALPLLGYRHISGHRQIDRDGVIRPGAEADDGGLLADLAAVELFLGRAWERGSLPRWLTDHAPINYVSAVRRTRD